MVRYTGHAVALPRKLVSFVLSDEMMRGVIVDPGGRRSCQLVSL